ncbi:glycoside hydrolase family 66 protein [Fundicoccus culcitae]|uniref:Glycoside hydrolase family 66 protein n=1 Tax=Fundicoccus culcitae TaxID=2969821 RepID=A0ABY5PA76_9LACT|nr:glycoside hydrolase family 66 protein [Fundicoccus culcitae]UUX35474.1 glycoside hydrolase family 66 protein [Fundicoccus culcitae]
MKIKWCVLTLIFMIYFNNSGIVIASEHHFEVIDRIILDKARYIPGEVAKIEVTFIDNLNDEVEVNLSLIHLDKLIDESNIIVDLNNNNNVIFNIPVGSNDYLGYLLFVEIYSVDGKFIDSETSALDVSSSWHKFPRYGYLTDYQSNIDTQLVINQMKDWQFNAIEFYDWKYLHQQPIPPNDEMVWEDWAGRKVDGNIVKSYINDAKRLGISSLSYNMVYGATNNYRKFGIEDEWRLFYAEDHGELGKMKGDPFTFSMGYSPTGQSNLYFFDIDNPNWQNYIIDKNIDAMKIMGFDGWHGDTVGEWGKMWSYDDIGDENKGKYVKDSYREFLNIVKERLGSQYDLVFNPVGAQGIELVNQSNVDVLYAEIWPWDRDSEGNQYDTYYSIKMEIDQTRKESGGKSLIVPAYIHYDYAKNLSNLPFNESAVLLMDAAVYSAGGSRIEIGDGNQMLSNEYFPSRNLYMTEVHQKKQKDYQNFIVAYQNLLRDGLEDNEKKILIDSLNFSNNGEANTIWGYSKEDDNYEVIHLINLLDVMDNTWRSNDGEKMKPRIVNDFTLKYYTDEKYETAYLTSPDTGLSSKIINLYPEYFEDEYGKYLEIKIPIIEYWDMIFFDKNEIKIENIDFTKSIEIVNNNSIDKLVNGDFTSGLKGWMSNNSIAIVKNNHLIIEGENAIEYLEQSISSLEDGIYKVSIIAKQSSKPAHKSRLILVTNNQSVIELEYGDEFVEYEELVEVNEGRLRLRLEFESNNQAMLEVDSIKIEKLGDL